MTGLALTCATVRVDWSGKAPTIYDPPESRIDCGKPAVIVILNAPFYDTRGSCETCGYDSEPTYAAYCADHASEQVHEASSSMSADEFTVVNLGTAEKLESVRKYAEWAAGGAPYDATTAAEEVLAIITGEGS